MEEAEYVTLEDGKDYFVIDIIDDYAYLSLEDDTESFCIRKLEKDGDDEYFTGLSSDNEFDKALLKFTKKHKEFMK